MVRECGRDEEGMKKWWVGMYNCSLYIPTDKRRKRRRGEDWGGRSSEELPHVDVKNTVFSDAEPSRPVTLLNVLHPGVEKKDFPYLYVYFVYHCHLCIFFISTYFFVITCSITCMYTVVSVWVWVSGWMSADLLIWSVIRISLCLEEECNCWTPFSCEHIWQSGLGLLTY